MIRLGHLVGFSVDLFESLNFKLIKLNALKPSLYYNYHSRHRTSNSGMEFHNATRDRLSDYEIAGYAGFRYENIRSCKPKQFGDYFTSPNEKTANFCYYTKIIIPL